MEVPLRPRIAAGCVFGLGFAILGAFVGSGALLLLVHLYSTLTDPPMTRNGEYIEVFFFVCTLGALIGAAVGFLLLPGTIAAIRFGGEGCLRHP